MNNNIDATTNTAPQETTTATSWYGYMQRLTQYVSGTPAQTERKATNTDDNEEESKTAESKTATPVMATTPARQQASSSKH